MDSSKRELANLKESLKNLAQKLASKNSLSEMSPIVFPVLLQPGTGKACDIAHALVNSSPYITEITAVDDSRLLISLSGSTPEVPAIEGRLRHLAADLANPTTPTAPKGNTIVQRLYYNHDPLTVATIINAVYPNVKAQAMRPDLVILSDATDVDEGRREAALKSAQRTITRIDQPHPQVSVDAWSLQLATTDEKGLGKTIPILEDLAGAYNQAINQSLDAGWRYVACRLAQPGALDPLLQQYLTYKTQVNAASGTMTLVEPPSVPGQSAASPNQVRSCEDETDPIQASGSNQAQTAQQAPTKGHQFGLGFSTLYYPLTPNLIDMLVTLASLRYPREVAATMFDKMGTARPPGNNPDACRARDKKTYDEEIKRGEKASPARAYPEHLQLGCVRDVLMNELFAQRQAAPATSSLGQLRGALADFLFHYKLMVKYPDDFHSYLEPIAADTLDSALVPVVNAFDEDLSVLQASLQTQIAKAIHDQKKGITYGYGGLVNLKVLSAQAGAVKTATQNYFDATPPATLNDFLTNLQAAGAGAAKSPLTSMMTNLVPEKAAAEEAVTLLTALSQTLTPKTTTAHLGRGLDLDVTAHTLSGAIGAELDLSLKSTENGAGLIKAGSDKPTDDLNSRVSQHTVDTHVRLDSINLFRLSTLSSTLARGRPPWKPFDPVEVPVLGLVVKVPRKPNLVYTQSLVFVDAIVVPTAADLGYGVPISDDQVEVNAGYSTNIRRMEQFPDHFREKLLDYHNRIVACLNREYIDEHGAIRVARDGKPDGACDIAQFSLQ
jgi:hypothetical protein